jgi:hypothetical protein
MIRRARLLAMAMGGLLASAGFVHAAGKAGAVGAAFLKIAPGARAAALGEAFTAVADDASTLIWNPAGLARLRRPEIAATHSQWLQEADHDFMAAALPVSAGTLGLGVTSFSVPNIPKRASDSDAPDGVFDARDAAYNVGWGQSVGDDWAVGLTASYLRQTIDGRSAAGAAATLGALWRTPWRALTAGLALRNLGGEIKFDREGDPLPTTAALGAALRSPNGRFTFSTDLRLPSKGDLSESAGVEYTHPLFNDGRGRLRAGYNSAAADADGASGLSLGLGLDFSRWAFDVTWAPYGALGDSFRYGFRVSF